MNIRSKFVCYVCALNFILVSAFSSSAFADELTTFYNSDLIQAGNMFDIVALNDVVVRSFAGNYSVGNHTVELWHRQSPYAGFESSSAGWTLLSTSNFTSAGSDLPSSIPGSHSIKVPKGETHSFYITAQTNVQEYTTGTTLGAVLASDTNLEILEGAGVVYPFGAIFEPRDWNGTITYTPITNPPAVFQPTNKTISEDTLLSESFSVADSFYSPDMLSVTATSSNTSLIPNANISILGSGGSRTIELTPSSNLSGSSTISISATTPSGRTISQTFIVSVTAVNDAPVANPLSVFTDEDNNIGITLSASDIDSMGLNFAVDQGPTNGTLIGSAPNLTYRPNANFFGTDSFTFHANDGALDSTIVIVSITIASVNDRPTADARSLSTNEDVPLNIVLSGNDVDNDPLAYSVVNAPIHGSLSGVAPNLTYTPNADYNGADSFNFRVSDGQINSALTTISITILSVNDAPRFVLPTPLEGESFNLQEGQLFSASFVAVDADSDPLSKIIGSLPAGANFNPISGVLTWTPSYTDEGTHAVSVTVSDSQEMVTRRITLTVSIIDNDNDGLPDTWEIENGLLPTTNDSDNDQISDLEEVGPSLSNPRDSDNDNVIDALDSDSDNDGLSDLNEAGDSLVNTPPINSDNDNLPDYRDPDSDDDSIRDDVDNCRLIDNASQADLDQDQIGDVCDNDIDGDGLGNDFEIALMLDPLHVDSDRDTIPDGLEIFDINDPRDFDQDGTIDALDLDSDGDTLSDAIEAGDADLLTEPIDSDNDMMPDYVDTDSDNDTIGDQVDNCYLVPNTDQADSDVDGSGDLCDMDIDGDGIADAQDNCPLLVNADQLDTDNDGIGDLCDSDFDGDQIDNAQDNCPMTPNADQSDLDNDEIGDLCDDDADGDDVLDSSDNCLGLPNSDQSDMDEDGMGDLCDEDADGDTIGADDNCPLVKNKDQKDADEDGIGDLCDEDRDGDSVDNSLDNCPDIANENQFDVDGDMMGDLCDDTNDSLKEVACGDGFDDDKDGLIDCQDPDCADLEICESNDVFEPNAESEACACRITKKSDVSPWFLLLLLGLLVVRKKSKR